MSIWKRLRWLFGRRPIMCPECGDATEVIQIERFVMRYCMADDCSWGSCIDVEFEWFPVPENIDEIFEAALRPTRVT